MVWVRHGRAVVGFLVLLGGCGRNPLAVEDGGDDLRRDQQLQQDARWMCTTNADCDDQLDCTSDRCLAGGVCEHQVAPAWCAIVGACYGAGATDSADPCNICDPLRSQDSWSRDPTCVDAGGTDGAEDGSADTSPADATADSVGDAEPDGAGDALPDGAGDAQPDAGGDARLDAAGDAWPDGAGDAQPDHFVWPDQGADDWPSYPDSYGSGAPYGCESDADCFGLRCCRSPWGVKLCLASCEEGAEPDWAPEPSAPQLSPERPSPDDGRGAGGCAIGGIGEPTLSIGVALALVLLWRRRRRRRR